MLAARGLGYAVGRDGGQRLLDAVDVEVAPGEIVALLGPNGAGKTTLLRCLSGQLAPAAGSITLEGAPLRPPGRPRDELLRERARRLAVLPQSSALAFDFTALQVALLGRTPHVLDRESAHDVAVARAALAHAGVGHLERRRYPSLSGGEQQRVQLARVLAQIWDPPAAGHRYLLLDEPVASLDVRHQLEVLDLLVRWSAEGVGVLLSIHDLNLAARYADRVVLLRAGRLAAAGPPGEVLDAARLRAVFDVEARVDQAGNGGRPLIHATAPS